MKSFLYQLLNHLRFAPVNRNTEKSGNVFFLCIRHTRADGSQHRPYDFFHDCQSCCSSMPDERLHNKKRGTDTLHLQSEVVRRPWVGRCRNRSTPNARTITPPCRLLEVSHISDCKRSLTLRYFYYLVHVPHGNTDDKNTHFLRYFARRRNFSQKIRPAPHPMQHPMQHPKFHPSSPQCRRTPLPQGIFFPHTVRTLVFYPYLCPCQSRFL